MVSVVAAPPVTSEVDGALSVTVEPLMRMGICDVFVPAVAVIDPVRVNGLPEPDE